MGDDGEKSENESSNKKNKCRIIIIGAGMAGLSAAIHLLKNGIEDFKIIEARKRVGGRIISIPLTNQKVELGANWIHGVLGNPIFEMAMAHRLVDIVNVPKPHKVIAATEDGKQVPFGMLHEIYEAYICFLRRCEEYFLCQYLPPPDVHSVGEHINLEAAMYMENLPSDDERKLRRLIFDCLLKRETCISGCDSMDQIDLLELGSYTELQGGNIMLPSGYSSILEPMISKIQTHRIITGRPVSKIKWSAGAGDVVSPSGDSRLDDPANESDDSDKTVIEDISKAPNPPILNTESSGAHTASVSHGKKHSERCVEVICENGEKYYSDHVICSIPLGVLKEKASSLFEPNLPEYKLEAIDKLLFGTVDKIYLEYDRPFLNPNITEVMLLWDSTEGEELADCWYKKIYSFTKLSETLLLGWVSGREAEHMETLPSSEVATKCTQILRKFLNDPYVPEPKQCVCTSWKNQTYSRGSYTAIAVGASQADIEQIAQPIYADPNQRKPVLLFAGEHTHSNFYSTVHGAYLSGRTAAQQLLQPDEPREIVLECSNTSDLSSWIQGISLN